MIKDDQMRKQGHCNEFLIPQLKLKSIMSLTVIYLPIHSNSFLNENYLSAYNENLHNEYYRTRILKNTFGIWILFL